MGRRLVLVLLLISAPLVALDSISLIDQINSNFGSIKTIRASVKQKVIINGREYLYSGYYIASRPGRVKVVYSYPDKYILWLDKNYMLNWYVPRLKVLYYFEGYTSSTQTNPSGIMPVVPDTKGTVKNLDAYNVTPLSKSGFLFWKKYYFFRLLPKPGYMDLPLLEFYVYIKYPVPYKVVGKRNDKVVFLQEMREVRLINGVYFPLMVRVEVRKNRLVTETYYQNVIINQPVSDEEFEVKIPPGVKRINLLQLLRK